MLRDELVHERELTTDAEFVAPLLHPVIGQQIVGDDLLRCGSGQREQYEGEKSGPVLTPAQWNATHGRNNNSDPAGRRIELH